MIPSFSAAETAVTAANIKIMSMQAASDKSSLCIAQGAFTVYRGCFLIRNIFRSRGTKSFGDFTTTIFKMLIPFGLYYSNRII